MKSKFGQKLLSWLLTAVLLVGLLPTAALAADTAVSFNLDFPSGILPEGHTLNSATAVFVADINKEVVVVNGTVSSCETTYTTHSLSVNNNHISGTCNNVAGMVLVMIAQDNAGVYYMYGYAPSVKFIGGGQNKFRIGGGAQCNTTINWSDGGGGWAAAGPKLTVNASTGGSTSGSGYYAYNAQATLRATASSGYAFKFWNDGNTDNPRTVTVTEDATYTAVFEPSVDVSITLPTGVKKAAGSGELSQTINNSSTFQTIILEAKDGYAFGSTVDLSSLNGELSSHGLEATYADGKITISQKSGSTISAVSVAADKIPAPIKVEATDDSGNKYATVGNALNSVSSGKITATGNNLTPVSNGALKSGVTLETAKGKFTAKDADATISMDANGNVTLSNGKLAVTGDVKASIDGKNYTFTGESGKTYTVDTASKTLTVPAGTTVTDGNGVKYTGEGTFTFGDNGTVGVGAGATIGSKTGDKTVIGVADSNTQVTTDADGNVTLTGGKGASNGKMDAKVGGKDMSFDGNGKDYVVDTDGKLTIKDANASVKADKATFTAGKNGETFDLTKDSEGNVTATLPEGASVKGDAAGSSTITGAASSTGAATKVSVDSEGNATLIKGAASAPANGKITAKIGDKTFDISSNKPFTTDLTKVPPQVGKLEKGESITVGGITYTCDSDEDDGWFPIESDKAQLKNNGDKAEVKGGSTATVKLGTGDTAPSVEVPNTNTGNTKLTKGQPSTVELGKAGDTFKVGDKTYTAAEDGAKFNIDDEGNVSLAEGAASVAKGDTLDVVTDGSTVSVTNPNSNTNAIKVVAGSPKSSAEVKSGDSVKIGDNTYKAVDGDSKFEFDKNGDVTLASGTTELDKDQKVIGGGSGKEITNTGDGKITVKANDPAGKDTVKVPADGKVKIGDTEYDAGANGATIIAGADSNKLTEGSVKLDKPETVSVGGKDTPVKNTGDKQIEVSADGKVTVPAGGELEIGTAPNTAKITDVTEDTTFNIDDNGKTTVDLPAGGSVTINGVTYTDDGSGNGKLTIDENGKVTGAENVKVAIDESKLTDKNFEYDLIPGVPVTVGKYTYTAPKTGSVGDVKLVGRGTDAEGKALNPAIDIKDNGGTVEVALKDKPETKTEYTAANAGTKFAMSTNDTDTTKVDLLDNGSSTANSALKFTDKTPHTVNGVTYEGQEVKDASGNVQNIEYTVSFGEASVDSGKKDANGDPIMETVNRNKVDVASGSKVSATMDANGTINIGSGKVGDKNFASDKPFTASNSGASILIDNTKGTGTPEISGNGRSNVTPIYGKKADGTVDTDNILGYQVTRRSSGGGSSSGSSVGVKNAKNGKIIVTPSNASKGTTVTVKAYPDNGYKLGSLTVTDKDGNKLTLTKKGDNEYTFVMPAGAVTVEGTFVKVAGDYSDCEKGEDCPVYPFADAKPTAWYHDGVHYCLDNGLMNGTSNNTFTPNGNITRGQIVTILWRQEGSPAASNSSFDDVASSAYYAKAVAWAAENGIVGGYGNGKFGPNDPITREQLAAILYRYAQFKGMDTTQGGMAIREYSDYDSISAYALQAMQWAVSAQIITGTSTTTLSPAGTATRAQAACLMQRFLTNEK